MSGSYCLFVAICLGIASNVYTLDLTLQSGETSDITIDATVRKIRTKCFLAEDNYFLRRVAAAQMKCFANTKTVGGIWKVTDAQLKTVQNACSGTLKGNCTQVSADFKVDIKKLTISDIEVPMFSGLVMSLYIINLKTPIPVGKAKQGLFFTKYINTKCSSSAFLSSITALDYTDECSSARVDLVFIIDASGSVGSFNFKRTLDFLVNIVNGMDIGLDKTRVAVIKFSSSSVLEFGLAKYSTKSQVISAIKSITYDSGGTDTQLALKMARTSVFTNTRQLAASKVAVLVTDGHSNSEADTIREAKLLRYEKVTLYAVGVVHPRRSELLASASEPSCTHYIELKDYGDIAFIVKEIQSESCKAPAYVDENSTLPNNTILANNETKQHVIMVGGNSSSGYEILVSVQCGVVTVYAAFNNSYPSEADYDYKVVAKDGVPGLVLAYKKFASDKLFITFFSKSLPILNSSACENPSYNISIKPLGSTVPNPCTAAAKLIGQYYFAYPKDPTKFIQCNEWGVMFVMPCAPGTVWNTWLYTCALNAEKPTPVTVPSTPPTVPSTPPTVPSPTVVTVPNPCTAEARRLHRYHFAYPKDPTKFIQCDAWGHMFVMPCGTGTVWNTLANTCTHNTGK